MAGLEYSVSVRTLCEFTAKSGDLGARFTPAPTAQQGMAGHQLIGTRRGQTYQRELSLRGRYQILRVRGRADGYDTARNRLEEFKTYRGSLERMPGNHRGLHWAQLKMYGAMLCAERSLPSVELALVYFDIQSEAETCLVEEFSAGRLQLEFEDHCSRFLAWAERQMAHREARDRHLLALQFSHGQLRSGQREMAEAAYRAAVAGQTLMIQAPTGVGKTVGALFPLLKAATRQNLDKVIFLTAKTPGRAVALAALQPLAAVAAPALRVLELVAKNAACVFPGRTCEAASCPLAKGFYDRLPDARSAALSMGHLDAGTVRKAAADHEVCPYYLAQELIRWCDVIIGDYNYFFDTSAILHALTVQCQWRIGLLVDEAHNLVTRGRTMYSASLDPELLMAAVTGAPAAIKRALAAVTRAWRGVHSSQRCEYAVLDEIPCQFVAVLQAATAAIADEMAREAPEANETLLSFYFQALHFCRIAEQFGTHSLFDVTVSGGNSILCIRCVNPGFFLRSRFAAACTAALFSATLAPADFYRTLLGLPGDTAWLNVASPFDHGQLDVRIEAGISTRYRDRGGSLQPIVELMVGQFRARPGNYLAFFSSFAYLEAVLQLARRHARDIDTWSQRRSMSQLEREAFLQSFTADGCGIGFAVLGGAFAEGIDLPGRRLIGAFIATLGLPQVNAVNEELARRMQTLFGSGYEYTYLYPGLQKVIQAAGRVIRTPSDRGTVVLIDDRYAKAGVRNLLPEWWRPRCS